MESIESNEINEIIENKITYISENIDYQNLEKLQKNIDNLDIEYHLEIAKILYKNNIKLKQNNNVIFVNLTTLPNDIIKLLWKYLEFINNQEEYINKDENTKIELEKIFFLK